jgi:hypothetical protein
MKVVWLAELWNLSSRTRVMHDVTAFRFVSLHRRIFRREDSHLIYGRWMMIF